MNENSIITNTNYLAGGFQYKNNVLEFFPHAEGYVKNTAGIYSYVFNYTDHLGNIRLSYSDTNSNNILEIDEVLEESHYYPFGLKHENYTGNSSQPSYKYKYNGKELQDELGLNMYAMDARMYDPAIARWVVQDPVIHFDYSPYSAFDNNPVFWADPSGADAESGSFWSSKFMNQNGGHWSDAIKGVSNNDNIKEKETQVQKVFRKSITSTITTLDEMNNGSFSQKTTDKTVNAKQLFYQWIMGYGSSTREFNQNSTMGQQMLESPEILDAITNASSSGKSQKFNRSLRDENPLLYVKSFIEDANGENPARAFHGSFAGEVKVNSVYKNKDVQVTNMTIIMTDRMTATSGTRAPPSAGGYGKNAKAIYTKENPYGPNGQFKTITVNYNMTISVIRK